jgi:hypothetical protein
MALLRALLGAATPARQVSACRSDSRSVTTAAHALSRRNPRRPRPTRRLAYATGRSTLASANALRTRPIHKIDQKMPRTAAWRAHLTGPVPAQAGRSLAATLRASVSLTNQFAIRVRGHGAKKSAGKTGAFLTRRARLLAALHLRERRLAVCIVRYVHQQRGQPAQGRNEHTSKVLPRNGAT